MMATRRVAIGLAVILGLWTSPVPAGDPSPRLVVIVHPDRRATLSVEVVSQFYLRRRRFWDDGSPVVPLNLAAGTSLREVFTRKVLGQGETRLGEYWNRQYFYGVLPPTALASIEAVRRYVAADRNAIGYVPADAIDTSVAVALELP